MHIDFQVTVYLIVFLKAIFTVLQHMLTLGYLNQEQALLLVKYLYN